MDQNKNSNFRSINYLGSKLRILDFIEANINLMDPNNGGVCDLFAGSGSVAYRLCQNRFVYASDIQEYSRVICSALINTQIISTDFLQNFLSTIRDNNDNLIDAMLPLLDIEENAMANITSKESILQLVDIIEKGSLASFQQIKEKSSISKFIELSLVNLEQLNISPIDSLITRYFGGVYFSYKQAIDIDIILKQIYSVDPIYKDILLAPLLSTASEIVNTVGKQFAQPLRPRDNKGNIKKNLGKTISKDRSINVYETYANWLKKYTSIKPAHKNNIVVRQDYMDVLNNIPDNISVIYADPPYTRDHYSRFYHVLETISLRDIPQISTTKKNGETKISRGLYREDRHQSPFCIKQQAINAFRQMFEKISSQNKILLLSYSPYDESKQTHPRVVTMCQLTSLAKSYFNNVEIVSAGHFTHNKLNSSDKLLDASDHAEVLIICS